MPYIVDGNNLAHILGLSEGGLADRGSCARLVAAFCRQSGAQAIVVFDGPAPAALGGPPAGHRLKLVYGEGRSADDRILRLLKASKTPGDFTVVTSDKSLGDKAKHQGATVERGHEFARRLDRDPRKPKGGPEKPAAKESAEQIAAWLAVFDPARK